MNRAPLLLITIGLALLWSQAMPSGCDWIPFKTERPDLAAIVYESESWVPPDYCAAARTTIEKQGIEFRIVDQDVVDGDGHVPAQIAPSIAKAKEHGLPALCVQTRGRVIKCVDVPLSAELIVSAIGN